MAKLGNRAMRNLSSAGWQSAKFTVGTADKATFMAGCETGIAVPKPSEAEIAK